MSLYGVREIANVTFRSLLTGKPALYLESLKTSSTEVTADAVYARGGRGNPKRIMWESNKEVKYNMQDALISPESLAILAGTEVATKVKQVHTKEVLTLDSSLEVSLENIPTLEKGYPITVFLTQHGYDIGDEIPDADTNGYQLDYNDILFDGTIKGHSLVEGDKVIVDYYYDSEATAKEIIIESGKFPGYYEIEADTIWTRENDGILVPAKFTMPRIKIASNFTISNAAEGEPSVFDFVCECFPDSNNAMVIIDIIE